MKLVFLFLATSALFTAAAIPMQSSQRSSSAPNSNVVPKIDFGAQRMSENDKTAANYKIINHYVGLAPSDEQKGARLAFVKSGWHDGTNKHRQHLNFDYHRGDTPYSAKIGRTVTLSRIRPPPPEMHIDHLVPNGHRLDLIKVINKEYKDLPPDQAQLVRSMKVKKGWSDGPGLREETQFTYHRGPLPRPDNIIGDPVTIYRPMSFLIDDDVPGKEVPTIKKRIRQEHENLSKYHPLKQANYGVVTEGWHNHAGSQVVGATLFKVKDQLSVEAGEDFRKIGQFSVTSGSGQQSMAKGSSSSSTTQG